MYHYVVKYWKQILWFSACAIVVSLTNQLFVLPVGGFYLFAYVALLGLFSTWASFLALQNFLHQKRPLDWLKSYISSDQKPDYVNEVPNLGQIRTLTIQIDEFFIQKWYVYISSDPTFNNESKLMLEEVLKRLVNVELSLDNESIIHVVLNLYLKHLKEFRRSLRRKKKYEGKISDLYQYSHICSKLKRAKSHFLHQLTVSLINHFINWELSNSLPCRILASVISRKVTAYLLYLLSNPEFLNYYILMAFTSAQVKDQLKLASFTGVKIVQITDKSDLTPTKLNLSVEDNKISSPSVVEVDSSGPPKSKPPKMKELKQHKHSTRSTQVDKMVNVKIHEPKSKTCKTWYDSYDLDSVTLGQDILDVLGDSDEKDDDLSSPLTSAKILLDEVKHMTSLEGIKTSMKPISEVTLHNIKDFQESTVNNVVKPMSQATSTAFHKIGGLHLQDEAAGVVEGILDFGRTKIRRGLRLTGLQDNATLGKLSSAKSQERDDSDTVWVNPLIKEEPVSLLKCRGDSTTSLKIPSITTESHEDSPEPEYEETADLASSIAKLRSLLEQKSSESCFSTPAVSPLPPDDLTKTLPYREEGDETDGMMPSFYKFCAKTATGVISNTLNTIKTALPSSVADASRFYGNERWLYVEANQNDSDLSERMEKLLNERKVFCTVDTAYEAIDSLQPGEKLPQSKIQFEDELDDFELKLPVAKALLDVLCEMLADSPDSSLTQEPVIKSILLLFGSEIEQRIVNRTNECVNYWCRNVKIPTESKVDVKSMEMDEFIDAIMSGLPDYAKYLIGESVLRGGLQLFLSSLQVHRINQDVMMQVFEVIAMKLIEGSKQLSPISA